MMIKFRSVTVMGVTTGDTMCYGAEVGLIFNIVVIH